MKPTKKMLLKESLAHYREHNREVEAERRAQTVEQRWAELNRLFRWSRVSEIKRGDRENPEATERWERLNRILLDKEVARRAKASPQ